MLARAATRACSQTDSSQKSRATLISDSLQLPEHVAIRRCSSSGGRANSCSASVFQLIVGDSEPTEISDRSLQEHVALHEERQELGQHDVGLRLEAPSHVARADAVEVGDSDLALIRAPLAEDDVARRGSAAS